MQYIYEDDSLSSTAVKSTCISHPRVRRSDASGACVRTRTSNSLKGFVEALAARTDTFSRAS